MPIAPPSRPQQKREASQKMLRSAGVTDQVCLIGSRGYYLDTMGEKGKNDRGIYDDAIILLSPSVHATFNANTDPSVFRKGIASLKTGVHRYKKGNHGISKPDGGYPALRPANPQESVPVTRDGEGDSMGVAINIHKGGYNTTSSLGCQTIYPTQWDAFINLVYSEMSRYNQKTIPYLLTENRNS
jgi:lysozyme